jgi:hypothetical protein
MRYIKDSRTVYEKWKGFTYGEELREAWRNALEFFRRNGAKRIILDVTESKVIRREDTEWYFKNIFPLAYQYGIDAIAIIESKSPISRFAIKSAYTNIGDKPVDVEFFSNSRNAIKWVDTL